MNEKKGIIIISELRSDCGGLQLAEWGGNLFNAILSFLCLFRYFIIRLHSSSSRDSLKRAQNSQQLELAALWWVGRENKQFFFMVRILTFSLTHTQKVGMTVVSIPLMDKTGRRTLHLYGLGGMFIFSIFITISFLIKASAFDCFSYFFLLSFDSIICGTIFFLQSVVVAARKFVEAQFTANLHVGWRKLNDFSTFLSVFFRLSHVHCSIRCE